MWSGNIEVQLDQNHGEFPSRKKQEYLKFPHSNNKMSNKITYHTSGIMIFCIYVEVLWKQVELDHIWSYGFILRQFELNIAAISMMLCSKCGILFSRHSSVIYKHFCYELLEWITWLTYKQLVIPRQHSAQLHMFSRSDKVCVCIMQYYKESKFLLYMTTNKNGLFELRISLGGWKVKQKTKLWGVLTFREYMVSHYVPNLIIHAF